MTYCWFCETCATLTLLERAMTGHCCQSPPRQDCPAPRLRAVASYRDASFPERACDHCGQLYQGPAVYCSLSCAVTDA
jgi:hypothetical protein